MNTRRSALSASVIAVVTAVATCSRPSGELTTSCPEDETSVRASPADSFVEYDPCAILRQARIGIEDAVERGQIPSTTLTAWDSVLIVPLTEVTSQGTRGDPTWQVQIFLGTGEYDLEAVVNRTTGEVRTELVHKPL